MKNRSSIFKDTWNAELTKLLDTHPAVAFLEFFSPSSDCSLGKDIEIHSHFGHSKGEMHRSPWVPHQPCTPAPWSRGSADGSQLSAALFSENCPQPIWNYPGHQAVACDYHRDGPRAETDWSDGTTAVPLPPGDLSLPWLCFQSSPRELACQRLHILAWLLPFPLSLSYVPLPVGTHPQ